MSFKTGLGIIFLLTIAGLAAYNRVLYDDIWNPETGYITQLAEKNVQVGLCQSQKNGLISQIEAQNKEIDAWVQKGKELEKRNTTQQTKINQLSEAEQKNLHQLDAEIIAPGCDAAMTWLLSKAIELQNEPQ